MTQHATNMTTREMPVLLCAEPGCPFEGDRAQQGNCHSSELEVCDAEKLDRAEQELELLLAELRRNCAGDADYICALESHYVSVMLNWDAMLDQCVRLRRENALLRKKVGA